MSYHFGGMLPDKWKFSSIQIWSHNKSCTSTDPFCLVNSMTQTLAMWFSKGGKCIVNLQANCFCFCHSPIHIGLMEMLRLGNLSILDWQPRHNYPSWFQLITTRETSPYAFLNLWCWKAILLNRGKKRCFFWRKSENPWDHIQTCYYGRIIICFPHQNSQSGALTLSCEGLQVESLGGVMSLELLGLGRWLKNACKGTWIQISNPT